MPSTVEQSQRRRERFEARALCHFCGQEPPFLDNKACKKCLLKRNNAKAIARAEARQKGKCQECRLNPISEGHKHCEDCLRRARERAAARPESRCETCGETTGRKQARYCAQHRPRRIGKYFADERITEMIRVAYAQGPARKADKGKSYLSCVAEKIGWPYWAVQKAAARIGVARIKEAKWSAEELQILEANAHWTPSTIRQRLRARGYFRSINAIEVKRNRLRLAQNHSFLTPHDLALNCFGVRPEVIQKWIKRGWLKAMERDVNREGDYYWISREAVYNFVLKHPMAFDIRKVDQLWFIDLVTQGKVGLSHQEINKEQKQPSIVEMEKNEFGS